MRKTRQRQADSRQTIIIRNARNAVCDEKMWSNAKKPKENTSIKMKSLKINNQRFLQRNVAELVVSELCVCVCVCGCVCCMFIYLFLFRWQTRTGFIQNTINQSTQTNFRLRLFSIRRILLRSNLMNPTISMLLPYASKNMLSN